MSSLSLGELYVRLSLRNQQFAKGVADSTKRLEAFGRKVNEVGGKLGALGVAGTAALAGFARTAAQVNKSVAADARRVEGSFRALSNEVGQALQPAMQTLADSVGRVATYLKQMDPETRRTVGSFVAFGSAALVAVGAMSKLIGAVTALAPLASAVVAFGPAFLAAAAAAGALWVMAAMVREAWDTNLLGIRDTFEAIWDWMVEKATAVFDWFRESLKSLGGWFVDAFNVAKRAMVDFALKQIEAFRELNKLLGINTDGLADFARDLVKWADYVSTSEGFAELGKDAKVVFDGIRRGANKNLEDILRKIREVTGAFGGLSPLSMATPGKPVDLGHTARPVPGFGFNLPTPTGAIGRRAPDMGFADRLADGGKKIAAATNSFVSAFGSSLGKLSGIIQAGLTGGVVGVVVALVSESKQFGAALGVVTGIIQLVADTLGTILEPLYPLLGAIGVFVRGLMDAIEPALNLLASALEPLIPPIVLVGKLMQALAPVLGMVAQAVLLIMNPLLALAGPIFKGLFFVLKGVAVVLMGFAIGVGKVWNGILDALLWVLKAVDKIPGVNMSGAIKKLDDAKADTDEMERDLRAIWRLSWEDANAIALHEAAVLDGTEAQKEQTETVRRLTEELTNVPSGYKVAVARFAAMATGSTKLSNFIGEYGPKMPKFAAGGIVTKPTVGLIGEGGQSEAIIPLSRLGDMVGRGGGGDTFHVTIVSDNPERIWAQLQRLMERDNFRRNGTLVQAGPRLSTARG